MELIGKTFFLLLSLVICNVAVSQCAINLQVNQNNVPCTCNNGAAMVTATGGVPPYTYVWKNNITPASVSIFPSKDNSIYEQSTANSNGAGEFFTAGVTAANFKNRALLAFDLVGSIPSAVTINSATLTINLNLSSGQNGATLHYLHKITQNWGEGSSNAGGPGQGVAATTNDATWLKNFYPNSDWSTPGGTFNTSASASTLVNQGGFYNWSSAGMVADIQAWMETPGVNFGWLLKSDELGIRSAKRYASRENGTLQNRPVLTISFGPGIIGTSGFINNLAPGIYTITVSDSNGCTATATITILRIN